MCNNRIKVLYIAGSGRSGSTILGTILGQIEGFFFVGEILNIWTYFLIENRLCACGVSASECKMWRPVLNEAFGGTSQIEIRELDYLRKHSIRNRYIPEMLVPWQKAGLRDRLEKYLDALERLYRAVHSASGSQIIVDGSKRPTYGYLLRMVPSIDLCIVHLIRDSRAVAYSWLRRKVQQDTGDHSTYMPRSRPAASAVRWDVQNLATELFWRDSPERYLAIRYEDLIDKPQKTIRRVLDLVQETPSHLPFVADRTVKLETNHSIWGNPNRFNTGLVELRLDVEWERRIKWPDNVTVTAFTWPLLWKYGYLR